MDSFLGFTALIHKTWPTKQYLPDGIVGRMEGGRFTAGAQSLPLAVAAQPALSVTLMLTVQLALLHLTLRGWRGIIS